MSLTANDATARQTDTSQRVSTNRSVQPMKTCGSGRLAAAMPEGSTDVSGSRDTNGIVYGLTKTLVILI